MKIIKKIRHFFSQITLTNKFILLFLSICLVQTIISLFLSAPANSEMEKIDVIIRTSVISIFGYLLSVEFKCSKDITSVDFFENKNSQINITGNKSSEQNSSNIGFDTNENGDELTTLEQKSPEYLECEMSNNKLQTTIISFIGIFCLIMLILMRNIDTFDHLSPSAIISVAQFRDLVSGSIGFLIGNPKRN